MKLQDVQKKQKKNSVHTIRTTKQKKEWLDKHRISPTLLFNVALDELIKEPKWKDLEVKKIENGNKN